MQVFQRGGVERRHCRKLQSAKRLPASIETVKLKPCKPWGAFHYDFDDFVRQSCDDAVAQLEDLFIVLHVVDGLNTGLRMPGKPLIKEFCIRFGSRLFVVLDACQGRIQHAPFNWVCVAWRRRVGDSEQVLWALIFAGLKEYLTAHERPDTIPLLSRHVERDWESLGLLLRWACGLRDMELFEAQGDAARLASRDGKHGWRKLVRRKGSSCLLMRMLM